MHDTPRMKKCDSLEIHQKSDGIWILESEDVVLIGFGRAALPWSIRTLFLAHLPIPRFWCKWTCRRGRLCGLVLLCRWPFVTFNATRDWSLFVRLDLLQLAHHLAIFAPIVAIPSSRPSFSSPSPHLNMVVSFLVAGITTVCLHDSSKAKISS